MTHYYASQLENDPGLEAELELVRLKDAGAFAERFETALAVHRAEIASIAGSSDDPTFDNVLKALETSGRDLSAVGRAFAIVTATTTTDELQALERSIHPILSQHFSSISHNAPLFQRVEAVLNGSDVSSHLSVEEKRLVRRTHERMVRSGARLPEADRTRLAEIDSRLSALFTAFRQNMLADETGWTLELSPSDLAGLPTWLVGSLENAGKENGRDGPLLTLSRSLVVPFLEHSERSDLRSDAFEAWIRRGEHEGAHDNRPIMAEILQLRAEKAKLLGFPDYAAYKLDDQMAKSADNVRDLLMRVWEPARQRAAADAEALHALAEADGANRPFEAADWRYYAEKRRRRELDFDEAVLKPYLSLERMIEAAFDVAHRLFGLRFQPIETVTTWHRDVLAWKVLRADGSEQGYFLGDYFARSTKRSGAWMSVLRAQHRIDGGETPIIYNVCNFAKPRAGEPALLSFDEATTLFHEFGHALHGLMSNVEFPSLSGTSVARDFVELPSQLFEHWLMVPEILQNHARHYKTGEPIPSELVAKARAARTLDAGFDTVEYTASAIVDLELHETGDPERDPLDRERETLRKLGMPEAIVMRHRSPHFAHVFASEGYSSGYYSYLWSEVLDADAFEAFVEMGDPFHAETAARLLEHVYSAGDSDDAATLYSRFRGREPDPAALMRKRGFVPKAA